MLLDIDNTLLPRDTKIMPSDVLDWIELVKSLNIKVCLLSNNWHSEILEVAKSLDLPIVTHAVKPLPFAFLRARHIIGAKRKSTLVIGDQLFTDVLGAHFLAMKAYMTCPLAQKDLKHTLMLRRLEKFFMKKVAIYK